MRNLTILFHSGILLLTGIFAFAEPPSAAPAVNQEGPGKWKPDYYRALVIHDAGNPVESDEGVRAIRAKIVEKIKSLNILLGKIDMADKSNIDGNTAELLKMLKPEKFPFTVIYFPENSDVENPLWAGYMTPEEADIIAESPARREIARRLLKGESAVWLFVESGIDYKDYRILNLLSEEIRKIGSDPLGNEIPVQAETGGKNLEIKPGKPAGMSIIRISRDDADEKFLLKILNDMEPEIMNVSNEPVLVPIHGRGKISGLLAGDEVDREGIRKIVELFSVRSVDSEKELNLGTALLLSVNWDGFAGNKLSVDGELPALRDFSGNFSMDDVFPGENLPASDLESRSLTTGGGHVVSARPPFPMKIINIFLVSVIGTLILLFWVIITRSGK